MKFLKNSIRLSSFVKLKRKRRFWNTENANRVSALHRRNIERTATVFLIVIWPRSRLTTGNRAHVTDWTEVALVFVDNLEVLTLQSSAIRSTTSSIPRIEKVRAVTCCKNAQIATFFCKVCWFFEGLRSWNGDRAKFLSAVSLKVKQCDNLPLPLIEKS